MTTTVSALFRQLASLAIVSVALVGCGTGYIAPMAPGGPEPEPPPPDAGPPPPEPDAGPKDAGPQPDAGDGCTIELVEPTPAEDLAEFIAQGLPGHFACASCHASSGNPDGEGNAWGPSDDPDNDVRWYDGAIGMLTRPDHASLSPTETGLYLGFSAGITGPFAGQHPNNDTAKAAVEAWILSREPEEVRTCIDAGPAPDPDPVDCTPTAPSYDESEAKFIEVGLAGTFSSCTSCHTNRSPDGTGTSWGTTAASPTPADWHEATYTLYEREPAGFTVETSSLYTHVNGSRALHPNIDAAKTATSTWMTYLIEGELPAGCE